MEENKALAPLKSSAFSSLMYGSLPGAGKGRDLDATMASCLTPLEALLDVVRSSLEGDTIAVMLRGNEKAFLVHKVLEERQQEMTHTKKKALVVVSLPEQVPLWVEFLRLNLRVEVGDLGGREAASVVVVTPGEVSEVTEETPGGFSQVLVDNAQDWLRKKEREELVEKMRRSNPSAVWTTMTSNLLEVPLEDPSRLEAVFGALTSLFPGKVEASCDLLTLLRHVSRPSFHLVRYGSLDAPVDVAVKMRTQILEFKVFLDNHVYDLEETYGEYVSEMGYIPDPAELPTQHVNRFLDILDTFGPFAAARAALLLMIELNRHKTFAKYERHFLLIEAAFTAFTSMHQLWDDEVENQELTSALLRRYSTPLLNSFADLLLEYKPEHVGAKVKRKFNSYDDPNALNGIVFVEDRFRAKVLYHFVKALGQIDDKFSFVSPQYVVPLEVEDSKELRRKQEESLRKFRVKESNLLISSKLLEVGIESVKCNLVLSFDRPASFYNFCIQRIKAKSKCAQMVFLTPDDGELSDKILGDLAKYSVIEEYLFKHCRVNDTDVVDDDDVGVVGEAANSNAIALKSAIQHVNRYCARLPGDTFTRLTPMYRVRRAEDGRFACAIQLPINCALTETVVGPLRSTETEAVRAAALKVLRGLQNIKEIEAPQAPKEQSAKPQAEPYVRQQGTTKRRQYYYKQIARHLKSYDSKEERKTYHLYSIALTLNCPIPEDQNTRGRKIFPPEESKQSFGLVVSKRFPALCSFPIYTRSGEVMVSLEHLQDNVGIDDIREKALAFHKYTFSEVLRMDKYPMVFDPEQSDNSVIILPLAKGEGDSKVIDRAFLDKIYECKDEKVGRVPDEDRKDFKFERDVYADAVVMPWYRNQDQPQYFYVAEICQNLTPQSDFPAEGFESFEKYYKSKYSIQVQSLDQPLLDVDHTSARLNFLTPRYVNRKGVSLPASSEETRRSKRENLDQKQILVPELCAVHPFPASLWRQTVSLPCIFYRLNSLLIANQIRAGIAEELHLGMQTLPEEFRWNTLNFGWTLSDVLKNRSQPAEGGKKRNKIPTKTSSNIGEFDLDDKDVEKSDVETLSTKLAKKINDEDKKIKKKSLEIGTWSNEMAADLADDEDSVLDEDEFLDPNMPLPDCLTVLDNLPSATFPSSTKSKKSNNRDWGTGIEQKPFRVISPTSNMNIPGPSSDDDAYSDFVSDEDVNESEEDNVKSSKDSVEREQGGTVTFEFRGDDTAEAVEDEEEVKKKKENLAKEIASENQMLEALAWPSDIMEGSNKSFEENVKRARERLAQSPSILSSEFVRISSKRTGVEDAKDGMKNLSIDNVEDDNETADEQSQKFLGQMHEDLLCKSIFLEDFKKDCKVESSIGEPSKPGLRFEPLYTSFSFDLSHDLSNHPGPSPSLLLQAITMSNSNDAINLERLETIGDSFLKYAITSYLFSSREGVHEGKLSHLRSKQVSNYHLYRLGNAKGLGEVMIASKFEPHDNWIPPCYFIPKDLEKALVDSGIPTNQWNMAELTGLEKLDSQAMKVAIEAIEAKANEYKKEEDAAKLAETPSFVPYNLLSQHSIPDKSIADCAEALIGAYLIAMGDRGALLFMSWLGLEVLPPLGENRFGSLPPSPSPLEGKQPDEATLSFLTHDHESFEEILGYTFKDRSYLLQAMTHASYHPNRLTDCYQRLEFLGDAVLDYLITRHLYEDDRKHSPGALTDLRSSLVNNTIFATLAVKFDFHRYFRHYSPSLQTVINRFVKNQAANGHQISEDYTYFIGEDDADEAEDVEVPKALGDIFESVAGAIFLDSGRSLDVVWQVYYRMMREEIERFSRNVPKSPIRELLELEPETAKFGKPEKLADGRRVRMTVEIFNKGKFKGIGRSYRIAKTTAAKCALRSLKKRKDYVGRQ